MTVSVISSDLSITGALNAGTVNLPDNTVDDDAVNDTTISSQFVVRYSQADGSDVASATEAVHCVYGDTVTVVGVEVQPQTAPTGGDKQFTVDVQKSAAAAAYATILSAVVTVDNTSVDRTVQAGTLSTTTASDGDSFRVVITASGSTGSQGQGVVVTLILKEKRAP